MANSSAKSAQFTIDLCWHLLVLIMAMVGVTLLGDAAYASPVIIIPGGGGGGGGGGGAVTVAGPQNAIEQVFCNAVLIMTGTTGKAVATIAVVAVGIGALLGKISWGISLIVALGIALVFGAASIVTALGGDGTPCKAGVLLFT